MSNENIPTALAQLVALMSKSNEPTQQTAGVSVHREGTKIVLPALPTPMPTSEAVEHLQRLAKLEEQTVSINEPCGCNPYDGAVAFYTAMCETFGWATPEARQSFFGSRPPQMLGIPISATETMNVVWGDFSIPGVDGTVSCGIGRGQDGLAEFCITGQVRRKHQHLIHALAQTTRRIAKQRSIYRGKAITLKSDEDGNIVDAPPQFLDLTNRDPLILPDVVKKAVEANIFTPVERADACRQAGIPLKRGVILAGPPGTGKTLTAQELAVRGTAAGWTYILIRNAAGLPDAISFATRYAPAIIFCEDIDQSTSGNRSQEFNDLLNNVDGINTKNKEIMLVFTSNNISGIERTLVRPGRIDAIIEFPYPDAPTREKLLRHYGKGLIDETTLLPNSVDALDGSIPSVIREAVERAKLYALSRGAEPTKIVLTDEDLCVAVETMRAHTDFFKSKREKVISKEEALGIALRELLVGGDLQEFHNCDGDRFLARPAR